MPLAGRFVVQSVSALLVVGLLALAAIVAMTVWLNERSGAYFEEAIAARDLRSAAVELRSAVQSAESSERGFVLTGNEIYLSPYGTAKTLALRQLGLLEQRAQVPGMPPVQARLSAAVTQKFADMDRVIAAKQERKDGEALAIIRTNRGKLLMDEINLFASGIVREADSRLTSVVTEQRLHANRLRVVSISAALLIMLVVGGVVITVYRYAREINAARDEVNALNASLENRVMARTEELARANAEIQRFAHIVSHDLRAPLVNIVGFAGELEMSLSSVQDFMKSAPGVENGADSEARTAAMVDMPEALSFIRSSTGKMDGLINAILRISREGGRRLQPEPVHLAAVIEASRAAIQHQLVESNGTCSVDLDIECIVTDRLSLEQIVGNLLDNAVKYRSKERPLHIAVRARQIDSTVRIDVTDNGRGISERDLPRVFELFKRAGRTDQPGEGIGLAYVQVLVRNLGGEITATSTLDRGTTFSIVLPAEGRPHEYGTG